VTALNPDCIRKNDGISQVDAAESPDLQLSRSAGKGLANAQMTIF
jgi:hypothetical protein